MLPPKSSPPLHSHDKFVVRLVSYTPLTVDFTPQPLPFSCILSWTPSPFKSWFTCNSLHPIKKPLWRAWMPHEISLLFLTTQRVLTVGFFLVRWTMMTFCLFKGFTKPVSLSSNLLFSFPFKVPCTALRCPSLLLIVFFTLALHWSTHFFPYPLTSQYHEQFAVSWCFNFLPFKAHPLDFALITFWLIPPPPHPLIWFSPHGHWHSTIPHTSL